MFSFFFDRKSREKQMLTIAVQRLNNAVVLHCSGKLIAETVPRFEAAVHVQRRMQLIVLELEKVAALDAAGLGSLASLHKSLRTVGSRLKLMNVPPKLERLMTLMNLNAVLEICSAKEMLELLCRAHAVAETAREPVVA